MKPAATPHPPPSLRGRLFHTTRSIEHKDIFWPESNRPTGKSPSVLEAQSTPIPVIGIQTDTIRYMTTTLSRYIERRTYPGSTQGLTSVIRMVTLTLLLFWPADDGEIGA
uniref:Uncharacterized protein n=1 Tax=Timema poppense TaxID=170557 RepID=A0A7R9H8D1_TIMPO|nr:unnamed protein product [Timema poppensis]